MASFSEHVWVVSCRSARSLDQFSRRTLLYRPDLRAYCPHGRFCPLVDDEVHQELYLHERKAKDRSETLVVNGGSAKNPRIPHVSHALVVGGGKLSDSSVESGLEDSVPRDRSFVDSVPRDSRVVIFVHGFSEPFPRIISYLNHLGADRAFQDATRPVARVGFVWPSQSVSYFRARAFAERAARELRRAVELFHAHNNNVIVVAHSMGCRVSLHALQGLSRPVEHLFLVGAGVASDSLNRGGAFAAERISARRVSVLYSRRDTMLRTNFPFAELLPGLWNFRPVAATQALGTRGCAPGPRDPKVSECDCSQEVAGHSTHLYFNSALAMTSVREAVEGMAAPAARL